MIRNRLRRFASCLLPLGTLAVLVGLVLGAGHFFAWMRGAGQTRVTVTERMPSKAIGVHAVMDWPADRPGAFQQSPMWDAVPGLPPVADRLPMRPQILRPAEQEGPYGGTWTRFAPSVGESLRVEVEWYMNYTGLVRWDPAGEKILPDLAESIDISEDARTYTFVLREGLRWSDGHPFSSADVRFWWDHLSEAGRGYLDAFGATLETPDPLTVRIVMERANGLLLERMAFEMWGSDMVGCPSHYLRAFHPAGRDREPFDAAARAAGFSDALEWTRNRLSWRNPECPRMWAWLMKTPPPASTVVLERNPYYPKVDPSGRQLPYIDRIRFSLADAESIALKLMRGDSPMQDRYLRAKDYSLLMSYQEQGRYEVRHWLGAKLVGICINRGNRDPRLNALFNDGRFARALSLAIDRPELNRLFSFDQGEVMQPVPHPSSAFAAPDLRVRDTVPDRAEANRLLDELGCPRGQDGWRAFPDGSPLRLQLDLGTADFVEVAQVVSQYAAAVGIRLDVRLLARELYYARKDGGEHELVLEESVGGHETNPLLDARAYAPGQGEGTWASAFRGWFLTQGASGAKPPDDVLAMADHWRKIEATRDLAEQQRHFRAILDLHAERRSVLGLYTALPPFLVVRRDMKNVPKVAVSGWSFRSPGCTAPELYALDVPKGGRP